MKRLIGSICAAAGIFATCTFSAGHRTFRDDLPATSESERYELDSTVLKLETIASHLNAVWDMAWGPDQWIWFSDQDGKVSRLNPATGQIVDILQIHDYYRKRLGLMSMVLHPDWQKHPHVFINYSHMQPDSVIVSKLVRYTYNGKTLVAPKLLYQIPGYLGHNGSRLVISKDRKILWATGDLKKHETIQNPAFANGKVLRLNLDGSIPEDNPYPGSAAWAMGFRVPQGLTYTAGGKLFIAEHGDATDDEVNLAQKRKSYGWPAIAGFCDLPEEQRNCPDSAVAPVKAWTPTIAPAGMDYYRGNIPEWNNALLLTTLKDQSLRVLRLDSKQEKVTGEQVVFSKKFGRLRDVCVSPSGDIYISTSNRDWNPPAGFPAQADDRIIQIRRSGTIPKAARIVKKEQNNGSGDAAALYASFCESCHKADGQGVRGSFPSLVASRLVAGDKTELLRFILKGSQAATGEAMPAFSFLTDAQLAAVSTFVRGKFGKVSEVRAGEVAQARNLRD
ncbi:PQQ-dependent sugar dehydrogenase [Dyadobacter sandarakinus]|uniref:PQQ-dependent sugar dehydrogenase n=1 Tax=Dyadobacter sandarakinus TaxID=2747268 RepID=A0ABX7I5Y8_9BACT|nr:PQQ-dependent sugar dehydrogenase [Dyadobacter sandarakinus]QRR01283.1 PQQ-dependent sugar dehydrogenase [Dyadobacter sandarakinus]